MIYENFIETCIQSMKDGTFKQSHAQQSKMFSEEIISVHNYLDEKIRTIILQLKESDLLKCHSSVIILSECNSHLQNVLLDCLTEILNSILHVLKESEYVCNGQQYCITIKALYAILQYWSSSCLKTSLMPILNDIMTKLELHIMADNIASDISLIATSSYVLLITLISSSPLHYFEDILLSLDLYVRDVRSLGCDDLSRNNRENQARKDLNSYFTEESKCIPNITNVNLNLIHGAINVNPSWLYETASAGRFCIEKSNFMIKKNCLLFSFWPFIRSHCSTASVHSYQSIQVLHKWIKILCKYIAKEAFSDSSQIVKRRRNSLNVVDEEQLLLHFTSDEKFSCLNDKHVDTLQDTNNGLNDSIQGNFTDTSSLVCNLCIDSSVGTLLSIDSGHIVELLNICFEKNVQGISNVTLECFKELLNLHECFLPGHSVAFVKKILKSISSDYLHSKGAYIHIQLAIEILGPKIVFEEFPWIPGSLAHGLKTNQYASLATNVYCLVIPKISTSDWLKYFESVHLLAIQSSDNVLWINYKNLWLPPTLSHHPELVMSLFSLSSASSRECEAQISVLRILRCKTDVNLFSEFYFPVPDSVEDFVSVFAQNKETNLEENDSEEWETRVPNKSSLSFPGPLFYLTCLVHGNENIRSELFTLLCVNKKASMPLCQFEASLLKLFFSQNLNVDSQPFRQSVMKSFHVLLCRIRDSSMQQIKKCKNKLKETCINDVLASPGGLGVDFLIWIINYFNDNLNSFGNYPRRATTLNLYYILLSTFYGQDKSLNSENKGKKIGQLIHLASKSTEGKYEIVYPNFLCRRSVDTMLKCCTSDMNDLRELAAQILILLNKNQDLFNYCDLQNDSLEQFLERWFVVAFQLIDSPKTNDVESGANLIKVLLEIRPEKVWILPIKFGTFSDVHSADLDSKTYHEHLITYLLLKINKEFSEAKSNILLSAYAKPISGTILALTYCLVECQRMDENLSIEFLMKSVSSLAELYNDLTDFVLVSLSSCSSDGAKIPPSFADMGKSIDAFVTKYRSSKPTSKPTFNHPTDGGDSLRVESVNEISGEKDAHEILGEKSTNGSSDSVNETLGERGISETSGEEEVNERSGGKGINDVSGEGVCVISTCELDEQLPHNFLDSVNSQKKESSYDHQMILSFFWHLLKMCCWSTSRLTQKYCHCMSDEIFEKGLVDTVVRVLMGTRHKGAMESAQESLAKIIECAFLESQNNKRRIEIVERQLNDILESLESSVTVRKISTTRKAAGYTMLFTAICSNVPRKYRTINDRVISRLLNIAQTKIKSCDDCGSVDLPSSLSLHILHSMVLCSKMNSSVTPYLSNISIVCLQSFASEVWSVRNAALQLFGAVVPKLLGQKKVKEDTALFNSVTAAEFCNRNPSLTDVILKLLYICSSSEQKDVSLHSSLDSFNTTKSNENFDFEIDGESARLKSSSFLVPLLSLLARLNPGNEIQQSNELRFTVNRLITYILPLLGNPVFVIRRLSSTSLVTLSNNHIKEEILSEYTETSGYNETFKFFNSITLRENNYIHGMLMFIENIIDTNPQFFDERISLQTKIVNWLKELLNSKCFVIVSLSLNILLNLKHEDIIKAFISELPNSFYETGASVLLRTVIRIHLRNNIHSVCKFIISDNQDIWEETHRFVRKSLDEHSNEINFTLLQRSLWDYFKNLSLCLNYSSNVHVHKNIELLSIILEHTTLDAEIISNKSLVMFQTIFNSDFNLKRYGSVVFAYLVLNKVDLNSKFESLSVEDILLKWAETIQTFSNPQMSEDCRLCASKALIVSFETVLNDFKSKEIIFPLVKASFNLLQDEDCAIRTKSSLIISTKALPKVTIINPTLTIRILISRLLTLSIQNLDYINLLWDVTFIRNEDYSNTISKFSFNLFESTTNNTFRETHILSELTCIEINKRILNKNIPHIETEYKSKASHFITEKLFFLKNLNESLKKVFSKNHHRSYFGINDSRIPLIKYRLNFLYHLALLFDIQLDVDFEEFEDFNFKHLR